MSLSSVLKISLLILLLLTDAAVAQRSLLRRGQQSFTLNGYIEPSYRYSDNNVGNIRTSSTVLTERMMVNLKGYFLDNRILMFTIGSNFINNDTWFSSQGKKVRSSSVNTVPYTFSSTILPFGRHPLTFFSSYNRSSGSSGKEHDSYTDFRVNGASLSLSYSFIPKLTVTGNHTTISSNSIATPKDMVRDFLEVKAVQAWKSQSRLNASYRFENGNDRIRVAHNSIRSLRMDGQAAIGKPFLLNGIIDYYRFNRLETLTANTRARYTPNDKVRSNFSFDFAEENDSGRVTRKQIMSLLSQGWISKVIQLKNEISGRRSATHTDTLVSRTSDITFRPGYYSALTIGDNKISNSYSLGYGYHERSDSAQGRSLTHDLTFGFGRPLASRIDFSGFYSLSLVEADYSGGTSSTMHNFLTSMRGRFSRRLGIRSRFEYSDLKSQTGELENRKKTYFVEIRGNLLLSRAWSSILGLNYRRYENERAQRLISAFSRIRFNPNGQFKGSWDVTYNKEMHEQTVEWVGDMILEYEYRNITLFFNWKVRRFSHESKSVNNEVYLRIRRSFDIKLK